MSILKVWNIGCANGRSFESGAEQQVSSSTLEYDGRNLLASISISLFPVAPLFAGAVLQY